MKKLISLVFILCFTFINLLPLTVSAAENEAAPPKPYEKVLTKGGRWYAEALDYNGKANMVVGYTGSWKSSAVRTIRNQNHLHLSARWRYYAASG